MLALFGVHPCESHELHTSPQMWHCKAGHLRLNLVLSVFHMQMVPPVPDAMSLSLHTCTLEACSKQGVGRRSLSTPREAARFVSLLKLKQGGGGAEEVWSSLHTVLEASQASQVWQMSPSCQKECFWYMCCRKQVVIYFLTSADTCIACSCGVVRPFHS